MKKEFIVIIFIVSLIYSCDKNDSNNESSLTGAERLDSFIKGSNTKQN